MNKCKNCGKEIAENLDFCSKECADSYKQSQRLKLDINEFPPIASGSYARERRIEYVKSLLKSNFSEEQIHDILSPYFTHQKIEDYIRVARRKIEIEG